MAAILALLTNTLAYGTAKSFASVFKIGEHIETCACRREHNSITWDRSFPRCLNSFVHGRRFGNSRKPGRPSRRFYLRRRSAYEHDVLGVMVQRGAQLGKIRVLPRTARYNDSGTVHG